MIDDTNRDKKEELLYGEKISTKLPLEMHNLNGKGYTSSKEYRTLKPVDDAKESHPADAFKIIS